MQAKLSGNLEEDKITSTEGQLRNVSWSKIIVDVTWRVGSGKGGQ